MKSKIELINNDIISLEKCLKIIEQTECYMLFEKSKLIFDLCEQINILKDKKYRHIEVMNSLKKFNK